MKLTAKTALKGIAIAMGVGAALMAMTELQRALEEDADARPAVISEDPLKGELQRCRTLTPQELHADTDCQAAWTENRRRFFGVPDNEQDGE